MHIMIVIHSLGGGGAERVAVDLAAAWLKLGYQVSVVTQSDSSTDVYTVSAGVTRYELRTAEETGGGWKGAWANWRRVNKLRRLFKRVRPDCVIGMMSTSSILAIMAARNLPIRVIATEHTHPPSQKLSDFWLKMRRWAYPRATAVVALTTDTGVWIQEHLPGSRVVVIPNAVRWPVPDTEPTLMPPPRNGRFRLLAVGRLHPVKGFDVLIEAFRLLARYFPLWDLVIVGDGPERQALQQQIDAANLQDRIQLVGRVGTISAWYEQSDLYVLSSRTEGLSNTLLEAMASGLAPVAFDCETGPREIIRPDLDGVLVLPVAEPEALAAHLSDLMAHPLKRVALSRRAVDVRDRFSAARVLAMWEQLLHKAEPASPKNKQAAP